MNPKLFWLITVLLLVCVHLAEAQQAKKIPRIGFLSANFPSSTKETVEGFRRGVRGLWYVGGKTITVEYRYAEGKLDRLPDLAAELVRLKVDVIFTAGMPASVALKGA